MEEYRNVKIYLAGILLAFVIISSYMANIMAKQKYMIEEYQKSLLDCENQTVGDKILDKIRERNND